MDAMAWRGRGCNLDFGGNFGGDKGYLDINDGMNFNWLGLIVIFILFWINWKVHG